MNRYYLSVNGKHTGTICANHFETSSGVTVFYGAGNHLIAVLHNVEIAEVNLSLGDDGLIHAS